jgi:hypothetical protein
VVSRARSGYPPPACDPFPAAAPAPRAARARGAVTLTEDELVRLITEAVERFRT